MVGGAGTGVVSMNTLRLEGFSLVAALSSTSTPAVVSIREAVGAVLHFCFCEGVQSVKRVLMKRHLRRRTEINSEQLEVMMNFQSLRIRKLLMSRISGIWLDRTYSEVAKDELRGGSE